MVCSYFTYNFHIYGYEWMPISFWSHSHHIFIKSYWSHIVSWKVSLLFYRNVCEKLKLVFYMSRNKLLGYLGLEIFIFIRILLTKFILQFIKLFRLSISSWASFGDLYFSNTWSILWKFQNLFLKKLLTNYFMSTIFILMFTCLVLLLVIFVHFPLCLIWPKFCQFYYFLDIKLLALLIFSVVYLLLFHWFLIFLP